MTRRKPTTVKKISLLEMLNEAFNSVIETDFKIVDYGDYFSCEFTSKNGNKYDLEFHYGEEYGNTKLNNGKTLNETMGVKRQIIPCLELGFTLHDVVDKDNPDEYEIDANLKEQFDVFGRMVYIVKKIISKDKKYKLFIIGANPRRNRMDMYRKIFENHFTDMFDIYEGKSMAHEGNSLFIIKK